MSLKDDLYTVRKIAGPKTFKRLVSVTKKVTAACRGKVFSSINDRQHREEYLSFKTTSSI